MTLNVKLTHPKVDQPFVAHTQKQIDLLTEAGREGGAWRVAPGKDNAAAAKAVADPKTNPTED
jgi:hypothetical protein